MPCPVLPCPVACLLAGWHTALQVKKFGRTGQTKWTHLTNEDTTTLDDDWYTTGNPSRGKRPGAPAEFSKPKKFKQ